MRDQLAHRYFDTPKGIAQQTVDTDLDELATTVRQLLAALPASEF